MPSTSSAPQPPRLSSQEDQLNFEKIFSVPDPEVLKPVSQIAKSFLRREVPVWLQSLGKVGLNEVGNTVVKVNEGLASVLSGFNVKEPLKFQMLTNVDSIDEFLKLSNEKLVVPKFGSWSPKLGWQFEAIKNMCKSFQCALAMANMTFSDTLQQQDLLQEVVLPGLLSNMQAIYAAVRQLRLAACPFSTPFYLKSELANSNLVPLWPEEIMNKIRQFFRFRKGRTVAFRERGRVTYNIRGRARSFRRGRMQRRQFQFRGRYPPRGVRSRRSEPNFESRV